MNFTLVKFIKFQTRQKWGSFLTSTLAGLAQHLHGRSAHLHCFSLPSCAPPSCSMLLQPKLTADIRSSSSFTSFSGWARIPRWWTVALAQDLGQTLSNTVSSGNLIRRGSWSLKWHQPCCVFLHKLQETGRRVLLFLDSFILYPMNLFSFNNNHCLQMRDFTF